MSTLLSHGNHRLLALPVRTATYNHDPLLYIHRETKYIEKSLQTLIDAQSDGLMTGLAGPLPEAFVHSADNNAPIIAESSSFRRESAVPIRQLTKPRVGLHAAREGISTAINDLLKLREEEREVLAYRFAERKDALTDVNELSSNVAVLKEAILSINSQPENQEARLLEEEAHDLEVGIRELEIKLDEMKARHQQVINKVSKARNSIEAKLSSYKNSLSMLESNISKYLERPPLEPLSTDARKSTFYSLPHKRRTLEMAREHWSSEQMELQERQAEVDREIAALDEGGSVWRRVVAEISNFERCLKEAMRQPIHGQPQLTSTGDQIPSEGNDSIAVVVEALQDTTRHVEQLLELAEDRGWKLLVCCISAELGALKVAQQMLRDTAITDTANPSDKGLSPADNGRPMETNMSAGRESSPVNSLSTDNAEPPEDLLRDPHRCSHSGSRRSEDENDEPDPAWLLPGP